MNIFTIILTIIGFMKRVFNIKGLDGIVNKSLMRSSTPKSFKHYKEVRVIRGKSSVSSHILQYTGYDSQRDNDIDPYRTCYPTSIAMCLRTLEKSTYGGQERKEFVREDSEDILIKHLKNNRTKYKKITYSLIKQKWAATILPRYVGAFWVWYINNNIDGYKAKYKYFTRQQLKDFIKTHNIPVVTSTKLSGAGGHIVLTIGFDNSGFFCNDPYGDARNYKKFPSSSKNKKTNYGKCVYYDDWRMKKTIGCVVIMHDN